MRCAHVADWRGLCEASPGTRNEEVWVPSGGCSDAFRNGKTDNGRGLDNMHGIRGSSGDVNLACDSDEGCSQWMKGALR
jgi:hypothetical protein